MDTRIYRVDEKNDSGDTIASFLVRASSNAQAVRHKAQRFVADVASQDDVAELIASGRKIETAKNGQGAE